LTGSERSPLHEAASWANNSTLTNAPPVGQFELEQFIREHLKVNRGPVEWPGHGRKWELEVCPFNSDHSGGCAVITQAGDGTIGFKCQHNSCSDKHWRNVRELFDGVRYPNGRSSSRQPNSFAADAPRIRSINDLPSISACGPAEINYLVSPVLPECSVAALTGDSGSGKSTFALALAKQVVESGRPVLILDRENPLPIIRERFSRLKVPDNEPLLKVWGGWLLEEAPQPGAQIVTEWVKSQQPRPLIILDSYVAFREGSENDAAETRAFMQQCRILADNGATVQLIHHDGKADSAKDYRGSSDFKAAVDQAFHLTNTSSDTGRLEKVRLRCFKSRVGFSGDLVYTYSDGQFTLNESSDAVSGLICEQLCGFLRCNPGIKAAEFEHLATSKGLRRSRAREFLSEGLQEGTVRKEGGERNAIHYFLNEEEFKG
jgi:archaellum biogenesis ATPase FlaH